MNDQPCHATREGDELVCRACRLRWDVNDAERPECRKAPPVMRAATPYHRGGVALPSAPHLVGPGLAKAISVSPFIMGGFVSGLPDREPRN